MGISFGVFKLINNISTLTEVGKLFTKLIVVSMSVLCKLVIEFVIDWVVLGCNLSPLVLAPWGD